MADLPVRVQSAISKLPPSSRTALESAFKRTNRKAIVAGAQAAKAPVLAATGGLLMGTVDGAAEAMGIDFSISLGPVELTPGLTAGLAAFTIGTIEGDPTTAALGSGAAAIISYQASRSLVADLLK